MGLLSKLGWQSKTNGTAPTKDYGVTPAELLNPLADAMDGGHREEFVVEVADAAQKIKRLALGQNSALDRDRFDTNFAHSFVGGYNELLSTAARQKGVEAYVEGMYHVGSALQNTPKAAERFAKSLVTVHSLVTENMGDNLGAAVREVKGRLLKETNPMSAINTALCTYADFDGRAAGPAQVAGTAGTAPG